MKLCFEKMKLQAGAKHLLFIRKSMVILAGIACFGLFYPDLFMVNDICKVIAETDSEEEIQLPQGSDLYYALLSAKPQDIKVKSRLLEAIQLYFERNKQ